MKKIVIIGSPGAGKSTFAQRLSYILDIEVIHLDRYFWQPGWKEFSRRDRITIEQELINTKDQWIIEGSYLSSSDNRLRAADTIIFLDTPYFLCLWRVITRYIKYYRQPRLDLPIGCTDRLDGLRIAKIFYFPYKSRKWLLDKIKEVYYQTKDAPSKKTIIVLTSSEQAEKFLKSLTWTYLETEHSYTQQAPQFAYAQ